MRARLAWLASAAIAVMLGGAALVGGDEKIPADDKEANNWHTVTEDERVSVAVERALYERPDSDPLLIRIRVTNRTTRTIGVTLDYGRGFHPNQWGIHKTVQRGIIDEERMIPGARTDEKQTELIKAFTGSALTMIPPNQSVTYFRDFNGSTGRSGRREIERQSNLGSFLIVSIDGQLFYTDGQSLHYIQCEWKGDFGPDNTDVVLKLPITWKKLPKTALVVEDSVRD
jgi:hypothetical protein